ncbi:MAG TPA: DUF349 domain-containing protein [Planctomycetota bacterium]|nr:DUF349 domain-containing protein [Planctomycetota bacterium]
MGLLDLFRPKWRHRDPAVRRAAVAHLESHQESIALKVATGDADAGVRSVAASRVVSEAGLRALLTAQDDAVQRAARQRLAGKAVEICATRSLADAKPLLDGIAERSSLAELVRTARDAGVRDAAFAKLCAEPEASQAMLAQIAIQDADGRFVARAVPLISRRALLKDVAKKAKREDARASAAERMRAMRDEADKPTDAQRRRERAKRLNEIAERAAQLAAASDPERAARDFPIVTASWNEALAASPGLDEDAAMAEASARIARARVAIDDRIVRARAAAERDAERRAFLDALAATPATDDAQRRELASRWQALAPASAEQQARFLALLHREAGDAIAQQTIAVVEAAVEPDEATRVALEALSVECEQLAASEDFRAAADRWPLLHKRWMQLTGVIGERHPLARRFTDAYALFKQRRRDARDARDAHDQERVEQLRALVARAEAFAATPVTEEAQRERFAELKALQDEWKSVGPVRPSLVAGVRTRFRIAMDQAFAPLKALQEAEDWHRFANAAKAEELIARVTALADVADVANVARQVRQAHQDWKALGAQPRGKSRELWDRFKAACDTQYERCKVVFAEQDAQRLANLDAKRALIAEVEALAARGSVGLAGSVADQQAKAQALDKVKEIQNRWKDIGPVPREHDRETWSRFRTLCDGFFAEGNRLREQEQQANLAAKYAMCEDVERMAESAEGVANPIAADRQRWLKQVRELQSRWKLIGHVPMAEKEVVWQRFKVGCDRIYALTKDEIAAQDSERAENLVKKQALLAELEGMMAATDDPSRLRDDVKRMQLRWRDIGHVPRDDHEALRVKWQELCDRAFR